MQDPGLVGVLERISDLPHQPDRLVHRQGALALESVAQGLALDQWHDEVQAGGGYIRPAH